MVDFGPLTAEIGSLVCGTPANFNGFCVLASLLQWRRSAEANQTLHYVWPSPRLVHCIYIFRALARWRNFSRCKIHFTSNSCVLLYWQSYCTALHQRAWANLCGVVQGIELRNFRRGCHLCSAGRPSRWAPVCTLAIQESTSYRSSQGKWCVCACVHGCTCNSFRNINYRTLRHS